LGDRRQELGVLGQLAESGASALTTSQLVAVRGRLDAVSDQIEELEDLSSSGSQPVTALSQVYGELKEVMDEKHVAPFKADLEK